jgi:hypothetical protein
MIEVEPSTRRSGLGNSAERQTSVRRSLSHR